MLALAPSTHTRPFNTTSTRHPVLERSKLSIDCFEPMILGTFEELTSKSSPPWILPGEDRLAEPSSSTWFTLAETRSPALKSMRDGISLLGRNAEEEEETSTKSPANLISSTTPKTKSPSFGMYTPESGVTSIPFGCGA